MSDFDNSDVFESPKHRDCASGSCEACECDQQNQEAKCEGCGHFTEIVDTDNMYCNTCCNGPDDADMDGCWRGGEKAAYDAEQMEAARRLK